MNRTDRKPVPIRRTPCRPSRRRPAPRVTITAVSTINVRKQTAADPPYAAAAGLPGRDRARRFPADIAADSESDIEADSE
ncbi:hypothetical protein GCM10022416_62530 [Actinomadura keratinilytica]|jgi:hypothetical protein|uniref:Uncharacterized protein n=1 Tax=Actinomadura keratinilytica TaxID=547461 RepID=A0ABP6UHQ2_9ACTN